MALQQPPSQLALQQPPSQLALQRPPSQPTSQLALEKQDLQEENKTSALQYTTQQQQAIAHIHQPYLQNTLSYKQQKPRTQKNESVYYVCTLCETPTTF